MLTKYTGTPNQYRMLHQRIERRLGRPTDCSNCHSILKRLEWANVSGEYREFDDSDWVMLCAGCHRRYDGWGDPNKCKHGHELTLDNLYTNPNGRYQECRKCIKQKYLNRVQRIRAAQ